MGLNSYFFQGIKIKDKGIVWKAISPFDGDEGE
jgi:hypothetical protein